MNQPTNDTKQPQCERCGRAIQANEQSLDVWALVTQYDENREIRSTGEPSDIPNDYVVFGECCSSVVKTAWALFINHVGVNR